MTTVSELPSCPIAKMAWSIETEYSDGTQQTIFYEAEVPGMWALSDPTRTDVIALSTEEIDAIYELVHAND